MKNLVFGAAAALAMALPATAQQSSYTPGNYTTISMIDVLPGQTENYMDRGGSANLHSVLSGVSA